MLTWRCAPACCSWAGLVTRRGEECLQLRLQDLLLATLFSKEQLALYIKAVYAVQVRAVSRELCGLDLGLCMCCSAAVHQVCVRSAGGGKRQW